MKKIKFNVNDCGVCIHEDDSTTWCLDTKTYPELKTYDYGEYEGFIDKTISPYRIKFIRKLV
jgi:hypothetical protein